MPLRQRGWEVRPIRRQPAAAPRSFTESRSEPFSRGVISNGAMRFEEYATEWKTGQRDLGPASVVHLDSLLAIHLVPLLGGPPGRQEGRMHPPRRRMASPRRRFRTGQSRPAREDRRCQRRVRLPALRRRRVLPPGLYRGQQAPQAAGGGKLAVSEPGFWITFSAGATKGEPPTDARTLCDFHKATGRVPSPRTRVRHGRPPGRSPPGGAPVRNDHPVTTAEGRTLAGYLMTRQ